MRANMTAHGTHQKVGLARGIGQWNSIATAYNPFLFVEQLFSIVPSNGGVEEQGRTRPARGFQSRERKGQRTELSPTHTPKVEIPEMQLCRYRVATIFVCCATS